MTTLEPDPRAAAETAAEEPAMRRIAVGDGERTVHLDDVDDVIGIAAELRAQAAEQLTVEDLKDVASQLDIEARYVDRAVEALERRRAEAAKRRSPASAAPA